MKLLHRTILTEKQVDGSGKTHNIIIGFDWPSMDQVKMAPSIVPEIKKTEEYKSIESLRTDIKNNHEQGRQSVVAMKSSTDADSRKKHYDDYMYRQRNIEGLQINISEKLPILATRMVQVKKENAVYHTPKSGEFIVTLEDAESLEQKTIEAVKSGCVMTDKGVAITDNRGVSYWIKSATWERVIISKIGVDIPSGGISQNDLSEDQKIEISVQIENDRVKALSGISKTSERDGATKFALTQAGIMKNELEIIGDMSALEKSKAWYSDQVAAIELKYA